MEGLKLNGAARLLAGPYLGEFGWELCAWNPHVRFLAEHFEEVVVLAPERSRELYEFADVFVPVNAAPGSADYMLGDLAGEPPLVSGGGFHVAPSRAHVRLELASFHDARRQPELDQAKRWRKLAAAPTRRSPALDVCLALRPPKTTRGELDLRKAWPERHAHELGARLVELGFRVGCVGGRENLLTAGAVDFRGRRLPGTIGALSAAAVVIGPSSGPMHLAQLCERPVVTWYDTEPWARAASRARYERAWNPFRAPCAFLEGVPTPAEVLAAALRLGLAQRRSETR